MILISILLPAVAGILLLALSFLEGYREAGVSTGSAGDEEAGAKEIAGSHPAIRGRGLHLFMGAALILCAASTLTAAWGTGGSLTLFTLIDRIPVFFCIDGVGRWFVTVVTAVWVAAGFYAFPYMRREGKEKRYFGCYLLLYGVLAGLDFSGNLVTMYLFYELMTLVSVPLVLHNGTKEAVMAALKYLFYSLCGAYAGLFGIFFLYRFCDSLTFTQGGVLNLAAAAGHKGLVLAAVFAMLLGFGAKAGMFPLHAWLPTAHPVAPSPASAFLSGIIVKCGVLAVIRTVFYVVGPDFIRGTWVQYTWLTLTLLTVFMGSLLAFREPVLKKRLAYSTVSQVSYILFGLALLTADGFTGAMLHVLSHALVKSGLFLTAGVFLHQCGFTRVEQLSGIGRKMPKTLWCYTVFSLALIGIPPTGGFISKWYLAQGALQSGTGVFSWLGPVILLISALLTAGYLLPVVMAGFFPGKEEAEKPVQRQEPSPCMLVPLVILALAALLAGLVPNPLIRYAAGLASALF
ncbi:MAG: proton-conducting membrane transporter [bacterium]|nr:proton-conducting membrane transporter [bacterium]